MWQETTHEMQVLDVFTAPSGTGGGVHPGAALIADAVLTAEITVYWLEKALVAPEARKAPFVIDLRLDPNDVPRMRA